MGDESCDLDSEKRQARIMIAVILQKEMNTRSRVHWWFLCETYHVDGIGLGRGESLSAAVLAIFPKIHQLMILSIAPNAAVRALRAWISVS